MTPADWLALANTIASSSIFWTGFWTFCSVVAFILIFCKPIAAFIGRTKKLGFGKLGAEAEEQKSEQKIPAPVAQPLVQAGGGTTDPRAAADALIAQLSLTPYIRSREEALKQTLADQGLNATSPETYRVLTIYSALALVIAECEQAYSNIWTTQIEILSLANTRELTEEDVRHFYDLGAGKWPAGYAIHPFSDYLRFLTAQDLLVEKPDGKYAITVKGRTFLTYLVHEGRPLTGRVY